jgi:hypothetical protein
MLRVPSNYGDLHRRFLQVLMNRRMVSYEDAFRLFCKMCQPEKCKTFSYIFNDCMQRNRKVSNPSSESTMKLKFLLRRLPVHVVATSSIMSVMCWHHFMPSVPYIL